MRVPTTSESKMVPITPRLPRGYVDNQGYYLKCPRCDFRAYGRSGVTDKDTTTKGSTLEYVDHFIATHVDETD